MFNLKKKKTGCETPEFRSKVPMPPVKPSKPNPNFGHQPQYASTQNPPSPPTSGSNAVRPNPTYVPLDSVKKLCPYELPCGYCTKWDKKCDKKIGCENTENSKEEFAINYLGKWVKSDNPCLECVHYGWNMSQCRECKPPRNNYKYFERKKDD